MKKEIETMFLSFPSDMSLSEKKEMANEIKQNILYARRYPTSKFGKSTVTAADNIMNGVTKDPKGIYVPQICLEYLFNESKFPITYKILKGLIDDE